VLSKSSWVLSPQSLFNLTFSILPFRELQRRDLVVIGGEVVIGGAVAIGGAVVTGGAMLRPGRIGNQFREAIRSGRQYQQRDVDAHGGRIPSPVSSQWKLNFLGWNDRSLRRYSTFIRFLAQQLLLIDDLYFFFSLHIWVFSASSRENFLYYFRLLYVRIIHHPQSRGVNSPNHKLEFGVQ